MGNKSAKKIDIDKTYIQLAKAGIFHTAFFLLGLQTEIEKSRTR